MRRAGRVLGFARPYGWAVGVSLAAAVLASVLDGFTLALLIPFLRLLFGEASGVAEVPTAVERVLRAVAGPWLETGDRMGAFRNVTVLIFLAVLVKNAAVYLTSYLGHYLQEATARDMRRRLFGHIQRLDLAFFLSTRGGQLVSRVLSDVDQARWLTGAAPATALRHAALVVVYVGILWALSWRLALVTLLLAPGVALLMRPILAGVRRRFRQALELRGELTAVMSESVEGARLVKAHGAEAYEQRRFDDITGRYFTEVMRGQRVANLAGPVSETIGAAVIVLLLVVGSAWATAGTLRPELFVTFVAVSLRLLSPVKHLAEFPALAEQSLAAADRVFEVLDLSPEVDPPGARRFPGLVREIAFDRVWVAYDGDDWVLRDVNLVVQRGEVVAIVGPSGAGKSTLLDLLPRFVEPGRGAVMIDGVPIAAYGRRSLRRAFGIVSQHTVIFHDTVRANLAYGDEAVRTDAEIVAAARAANAHEFIERLPQGYDTVLGERGFRLSGGERQRIAIARALLRDPPILILDEATSNVDAESERLIQGAIARLLQDRTVLVIAHRLSTVIRADQIVVLEAGRIVERGVHGDLVRRGGLYQRLHALELAGR